MNTVAVFFDLPLAEDYPLDIEEYRVSYRQLGQMVAERGGCLYVVRSQSTFVGGNTFSQAWAFDGDWFTHVPGPVTVGLVWNKGLFAGDATTNVINDPELDRIATDKWETQRLFPDLHPQTRLIRSEADWAKGLAELTSRILVVKPVDGEEGKGVMIRQREEIARTPPPFPSILQEFLDTSGGIPGLIGGMHDFRIVMLAGEVALAYIRTPPPGERTANVARGGQEIGVALKDIPAGALELAMAVDAKLTRFSRRIYTIDMGLNERGRWVLFELNTKPGLTPSEKGECYRVFNGKLADFLLAHASGGTEDQRS